jgi:hypothetical protein
MAMDGRISPSPPAVSSPSRQGYVIQTRVQVMTLHHRTLAVLSC